MKKSLPIIVLLGAFVSAIQSTDISAPADMQKEFDEIIGRIARAEMVGFTFDILTMSPEEIASLRRSILKAKTALTTELEGMDDTTKNWSNIAKGGLASLGGSVCALWLSALIYNVVYGDEMKHETINKFGDLGCNFSDWLKKDLAKMLSPLSPFWRETCMGALVGAIGASSSQLFLWGLTYGPKTFKAGLNYKQHLQNILANLHAIDLQIDQAKV